MWCVKKNLLFNLSSNLNLNLNYGMRSKFRMEGCECVAL